MSVTRQITAMPISTRLPRQSLIFCRELFRVIIFREIFLLTLLEASWLFWPLTLQQGGCAALLAGHVPLWLQPGACGRVDGGAEGLPSKSLGATGCHGSLKRSKHRASWGAPIQAAEQKMPAIQ